MDDDAFLEAVDHVWLLAFFLLLHLSLFSFSDLLASGWEDGDRWGDGRETHGEGMTGMVSRGW